MRARASRAGLAAPLLGLALSGALRADADLDAIRAEDIRADVGILASDHLRGREAGMPGNWLALLYAVERLRDAGVHPVGSFGYLQPIEGGAALAEGTRSRFRLRVGDEAIDLVPGTDYAAISGSPPSLCDADVAFLGFGTSAKGFDEYEGLEVRGKVVLAVRGAPEGIPAAGKGEDRAKLEAAATRGAAALLLVSRPGEGPDLAANAFRITARKGPAAPIPALHVRRLVADRILSAAGLTLSQAIRRIEQARAPVRIDLGGAVGVDLRTDPRTVGTANVVGLLEGRDPALRDEVVVVGAHVDHIGLGRFGVRDRAARGRIHNGADDNASGTAAVLEIAEAFGRASRRPRRSILFVLFNAEEKGLVGSRYFVEHSPVPRDRIVAVVNLDMVGRMRQEGPLVFGADAAEGLREIIDRAAEGEGLRVRHLPVRRRGGASDHLPFIRAGIPAVMLHTGLHPEYHRPSDDADRIHAEGEARIARLAARVVDRIAERPERLRFLGPPERERF